MAQGSQAGRRPSRSRPVDGRETVRQQRPNTGQRRRVAVEVGQGGGELQVDRLESVLQPGQQRVGRLAAHDRRDHRAGSLLDEDRELADAELTKPAGVSLGGEGVGHEVADRGEHPRDQVGVAGGKVRCPGMGKEEAGLGVNEEDLLDPVDQGVLEDDLGVGDTGAPGFDPPPEPAGRKAVLDRAVDRGHQPSQRLGDGLADRRAKHGEDGAGDLTGVPANRLADRALDRGRERPGELAVPPGAQGDRLGEQLGQFLGCGAGLESAFQLAQAAPLGAEDQLAKLGELLRRRVELTGGGRFPGCPVVGHGSALVAVLSADLGGQVGEQTRERGPVGLGGLELLV